MTARWAVRAGADRARRRDSIPPRVRKNLASARFFQLYSFLRNELYSTCGRVILLRSDIRPSVELRNEKTLFHKQKYHVSRSGTRHFRNYSKNRRGDPSVFHLFSSPFSLLSSLKKPRFGEVFSSNPSLQAAPICDILYNVRKHTGLSGRAERQIQPPPARTREVRTYFL